MARKVGYTTTSGGCIDTVKRYLLKHNFDISHFTHTARNCIKRDKENVFVENSTASNNTLRRFYLRGKYTEYKCSICGQEPIWNGKPLIMILDHINGVHTDSRIENLRWVCPNCNYQLETTGFSKFQSNKLKQKDDYFRRERKNKEQKKIIHNVNTSRKFNITREELKKKIRTQSFCAIGREFNVSDRAISKRCKVLNLPSTKKEINSYSDKEWDLI